MNRSQLHSESPAEDEAALWAAKLDGSSMTEPDRTALRTWLDEAPGNRALLSAYCQFSADLEDRLPNLVASGEVALPELAPARTTRTRIWWLAGTLAAAAALVIGIHWLPSRDQSLNVATSVAQRRSLTLADGTQIELNARTNLLVDLGHQQRHVRMSDGEAFFNVAKDQTRPFTIETPAGSIRDTGTAFDVRSATASDLVVTVVEGTVEVTPCSGNAAQPAAPVVLRANDQLTASPRGVTVHHLARAELEDTLAWRRGEVVFHGTPLGTALQRFAQYHGRNITADPRVAGLRVGGRYRLDNLDAFLAAVEAVLPVRVEQESSGAIVVSPRTGR